MTWARTEVSAVAQQAVMASHLLRDTGVVGKWMPTRSASATPVNDARDAPAVLCDGSNADVYRSTSSATDIYLVVGPVSGSFDALYLRCGGTSAYTATLWIADDATFSTRLQQIHTAQYIYSNGGSLALMSLADPSTSKLYAYSGTYYLALALHNAGTMDGSWWCGELWLGAKRVLPAMKYPAPAYSATDPSLIYIDYGHSQHPTFDEIAHWTSESGATTAYDTVAGLIEIEQQFELHKAADLSTITTMLAECRHGRDNVVYWSPYGKAWVVAMSQRHGLNRTAWGSWQWTMSAREIPVGAANQ